MLFVVEPAVIDHPVGTVHVYDVAPATAEILYVWEVKLGHCEVVPEIEPGVTGFSQTEKSSKPKYMFDKLSPPAKIPK